jgi:hypothetical protein
MNEVRVRRLASEGQVELTKKMFRRLNRAGVRTSQLVATLAKSELKDEDVFSSPDFAFRMGTAQKDRPADLVCVQTGDGRTVRIVGYIDRTRKKRRT